MPQTRLDMQAAVQACVQLAEKYAAYCRQRAEDAEAAYLRLRVEADEVHHG